VRIAKQLGLLFLATLLLYIAAFSLIEHRRVKSGPWQVTFTTETNAPAIVINQPTLGIRNVKLVFPGAPPPTNAAATTLFDAARPVPFGVPGGQCVFLDAISLPGTLTLELHGHQIQLLPRTLTLDHREVGWAGLNEATIPLSAKP
jgi:hypothetical protein